jgi:uncharacterized protein (DUF433 family)
MKTHPTTCFSKAVVDDIRFLVYTNIRKEFLAMPIERTVHPYIIRDTNIYGGEPIIEGTRTGVRHVILLFQSGKDPEEIASIHHLTLAQVYDALSYYYDNDVQIEHYIHNEP